MTPIYKSAWVAILGLPFGVAIAQEPADEPPPEEVIVSGTRAALIESLDRKRESQIVQDSIVAEDLGRFPDDNVADSLSHITGITLQRTRGGEGQYVNVRGLGPEFSIVTLNGRILATDGDGRDFAFDVLPSEIIAGADVYKSASAVNLEGSIGGAINLTSPRPLDTLGTRSSFSVEGDYNDLSENTGYKASAVFSTTFAEERMGVMLTAVYQDTEVRSDAVHEYDISSDQPNSFDANGDGQISAAESDLLGLCCVTFGARIQQKERTGVTGVWQWRVNERLSMAVDGMFTRLDAPTIGHHQSYYVKDSILDEARGQHRWSDVSIRDHWVNGMTVAELVPEISTISEHRVVDTSQFGWNAVWHTTAQLKFTFDAYQSKSERDSGGKDTWVVSGIGGGSMGRVEMNGAGMPNVRVTLADGRDLTSALNNGELGNADYGLHYVGLSGTDVTDKVTGASIAGQLDFSDSVVQALQFGAASTERKKVRSTIENDTSGGSCEYCNMYGVTFASLGANVAHTLSLPNFMRNAGGNYPTRFMSFDASAYLNALRALDGQPILDADGNRTGEVYDAARVAPELNPVRSYDVREETVALYVNAPLKSGRWFGDVGVRWVKTDTTARTAVNNILFVDDQSPDIPTSNPDVTYSDPQSLQQQGSYDKFLPAFNVGYWVHDRLLVRAAVAKVMARPSLNQLAPTRVDNSIDRAYEVFYDGNAKLKPVQANQADLSAEWYFQDKSVFSSAVFWKDIKDFITTQLQENVDIGVVGSFGGAAPAPILYDVSQPINGDKAKVLGLELGMQHFFDNGFGVRANYTYTDTKAYVGGVHVGRLEGVSKIAYSAAVLFEDERWDTQVAADYSGEYTEVTDAVAGLTQVADPIMWVTASVAYKITDKVQVSVEGRNLLDEYYIGHFGRGDMLAGFETWGRSYLLGATAQF